MKLETIRLGVLLLIVIISFTAVMCMLLEIPLDPVLIKSVAVGMMIMAVFNIVVDRIINLHYRRRSKNESD